MFLKNKYRPFSLVVLLLAFMLLWPSMDLWAQCPMCRIGAETNMASGGTAGNGLNKGILLLLGLPYILVGTFGFIWWKNRKNVPSGSDEI